MPSFYFSCLLLFIMSLAAPNELNKADLSLNSQTSLTDVRLPHALTSSTHRLGIDIPPNLEQLEPLIAQLNQRGLQSLSEHDYNQALVFFQEGQNLLEMVAGCGKSIDRQLILTILNNQAFVYHQKGKLDLSKRYVEAVIFNISSYLNHPSQTSLSLQIKQSIEGQASQAEVVCFLQSQWSAVKTYINRIKELSRAQLQYATLLAENNQNSASALMGLRSIKSMIEHFHLSSIYQTLVEKGHQCDHNKIIGKIIELDSQFNLAYFEDFEREVKGRMEGVMGLTVLQLSEMDQNRLNRFNLTDFLDIRPQEYKSRDISSTSNRISIDCSLFNVLQKYFQICCAYYLVGASRMRELNETQYLLGSSTEYEVNRQLNIKEAELYYFYSLKLILEYVPLSSKIAQDLIEAFNSRFNQEYRVRVRVIQIAKDHGSSKQNKSNVSEKNKTESISSSNKDHPKNQMDRLLPPTVDNFVLDLSCADSVDLNSNASMLELLKEGEEAQKADEDEQVYFQFMPKKSTSVNPLFSATANLQELRNQAKLEESAKKETREISIQRSLQSYQEIEEKKEKKEKKVNSQRKRNSEIRSKSNKKNSLEKRAGMKSIKRKGDPSFQTHYMSAYDLSNKERRPKNKSRMPEIKSERLLLVNVNPEMLKKPCRNQSKFINEKNIRLNKVKSPVGKPKNEKIELTRDTATRYRSKQKSKPQSMKAKSSKPKSLKKGLEHKKSQGKIVNIYLQRKK